MEDLKEVEEREEEEGEEEMTMVETAFSSGARGPRALAQGRGPRPPTPHVTELLEE